MRIGLISDTHGLFRAEVKKALAGASLILHAGDVGHRAVLKQLRAIAPVHAVFGNVDDPSDPNLQQQFAMTIDGLSIHVSHGHELGRPSAEWMLRALCRRRSGLRPHSPSARRARREPARHQSRRCGPRRFDIQPSVARLVIEDGRADAEIVWLAK